MNHTKSTAQVGELMSALADGQLVGDELTQALDVCARDPEAIEKWNAYCLIGDVLRSPELARADDGRTFLLKLRSRLKQEPGAMSVAPGTLVAAANDASFRWKLAVGFASFALVAVISWGGFMQLTGPNSSTQLVQMRGTEQQVLVSSEQGAMLRDARLEELLEAHRQFGGGSALQIPLDAVHNAVFAAQ